MSNKIALSRFKARRAKVARQIRFERAMRAKAFVESAVPASRNRGVYVLREAGTFFVKIGRTIDFRKRYPSLAFTCNPRALVLMGWLSTDPEQEARFHAKYAARRACLGGGTEWFEFDADSLAGLAADML